jgi:hypothetical protein
MPLVNQRALQVADLQWEAKMADGDDRVGGISPTTAEALESLSERLHQLMGAPYNRSQRPTRNRMLLIRENVYTGAVLYGLLVFNGDRPLWSQVYTLNADGFLGTSFLATKNVIDDDWYHDYKPGLMRRVFNGIGRLLVQYGVNDAPRLARFVALLGVAVFLVVITIRGTPVAIAGL